MKNYKANDICAALNNVGIEKSDIVMMHSSPITLGRFDGTEVAPEIIETIRQSLGAEGTLAAPAFNFDFCRGVAFDRQKTPSKNMGVLSETIRLLPGAKRSFHPMQSIAAIGKYAGDVCGKDAPTAFANGGSFARLLELNAKLLLFGVDFNAASFFHYAEEKRLVPYRYFKKFTSQYVDNGVSEIREYQMFVRDLELNPQLDLRNLQMKMEADKKIYRAKLGIGEIISCDFTDLYDYSYKMLEKDSFAVLKNREEVLRKLNEKIGAKY